MKKILFLLLLSLMALSACRNSEKSDSQSSLKQTPSLPKNFRPIEELSSDVPQKKEESHENSYDMAKDDKAKYDSVMHEVQCLTKHPPADCPAR